MKRQSMLLTALAVVALGAVGVWFWAYPVSLNTKSNTEPAVTSTTNTSSPELPTTITYPGQGGKNALELLKAEHEVIETNGFVNAIDGRVSSADNYWLYYINGQPGQVGAKDYVTKSTDTIEWRFESGQ